MLKVGQQLQVTELDFDQIKENLKAYFRRDESPFKDWDFEGSGLNKLLDVLSYNTHYNAILAHMSINESFLDSAQIRANVVSAAKLLGYTPRSWTTSRATINVTFRAIGTYVADTLTLPRGSAFKTSVNGTSYSFFTEDSQTVARTLDNKFIFTDVVIVQGSIQRSRHLANASNPNQKFVINAANADLADLKVNVYPNSTSTALEQFVAFTEFTGIDETSPIYFLGENALGEYEITFGNGSFGRALDPMSIVELEYIRTAGAAANSAQVFTYAGTAQLASNAFGNNPTVTVTSPAAGGSSRESINSIKFNAPISFIAQNRAVTAEDYAALIRSKFSYIDAISVWGGEDDPTPQYGKVFISIKPTDNDPETNSLLTDQQRSEILDFLRLKKVLSITPELVDPDYVWMYFNVLFKYDPTRTSLSPGVLETQVRDSIIQFTADYLESFGGVFRFSKFLKAIDSANPAINSSLARISVYKKLDLPLSPSNLTLDFGFPLGGDISQTSSMITCLKGWRSGGKDMFLADEPSGATTRKVYSYYIDSTITGAPKVKVNANLGTLNPTTGRLQLLGIPVDIAVTVELGVVPASDDVVPLRNQLLMFDLGKSSIGSESEIMLGSTHVTSSQFIRNS